MMSFTHIPVKLRFRYSSHSTFESKGADFDPEAHFHFLKRAIMRMWNTPRFVLLRRRMDLIIFSGKEPSTLPLDGDAHGDDPETENQRMLDLILQGQSTIDDQTATAPGAPAIASATRAPLANIAVLPAAPSASTANSHPQPNTVDRPSQPRASSASSRALSARSRLAPVEAPHEEFEADETAPVQPVAPVRPTALAEPGATPSQPSAPSQPVVQDDGVVASGSGEPAALPVAALGVGVAALTISDALCVDAPLPAPSKKRPAPKKSSKSKDANGTDPAQPRASTRTRSGTQARTATWK